MWYRFWSKWKCSAVAGLVLGVFYLLISSQLMKQTIVEKEQKLQQQPQQQPADKQQPQSNQLTFEKGIKNYTKINASYELKDIKTPYKAEEFVNQFKNLADLPSEVPGKRFPTALMVGAPKSGTVAFMEFLGHHPDVRQSIEIHFFDNLDGHYDKGLQWYLHQMPISTLHQRTIEESPTYFIDPKAAERIQIFNSSIQLMMIMRDPVKRLISDYTHESVLHGDGYPSFHELVFDKEGNVNTSYGPVQVSMYYNHLLRWLKYFPREQILVLNGELLVTNPAIVVQEAERFLNLKPFTEESHFVYDENKGFMCLKTIGCAGKHKGREHPNIPTLDTLRLRDFYKPYNEMLFDLLGKTFIWAN